jgi:hypothetical protein
VKGFVLSLIIFLSVGMRLRKCKGSWLIYLARLKLNEGVHGSGRVLLFNSMSLHDCAHTQLETADSEGGSPLQAIATGRQSWASDAVLSAARMYMVCACVCSRHAPQEEITSGGHKNHGQGHWPPCHLNRTSDLPVLYLHNLAHPQNITATADGG